MTTKPRTGGITPVGGPELMQGHHTAPERPQQRLPNRKERKAMALRTRAYNRVCSQALAQHGSRTLLTAAPADVVAFAEAAALRNIRQARKEKLARQHRARRAR